MEAIMARKNIRIIAIFALVLSVSCAISASTRWHLCTKMRAAFDRVVARLAVVINKQEGKAVITKDNQPIRLEKGMMPMPVECTASPRSWLWDDMLNCDYRVFDIDTVSFGIRVKECRHGFNRELIGSYFWDKKSGRQLNYHDAKDKVLVDKSFEHQDAQRVAVADAMKKAKNEAAFSEARDKKIQELCSLYQRAFKERPSAQDRIYFLGLASSSSYSK